MPSQIPLCDSSVSCHCSCSPVRKRIFIRAEEKLFRSACCLCFRNILLFLGCPLLPLVCNTSFLAMRLKILMFHVYKWIFLFLKSEDCTVENDSKSKVLDQSLNIPYKIEIIVGSWGKSVEVLKICSKFVVFRLLSGDPWSSSEV